jgi:hypothetical protein
MAKKVQSAVEGWGRENGHDSTPPPQKCFPSNARDILEKIIFIMNPRGVTNLNGVLL